VTVLRADPPWQVVYGRCIVGGAIVDIFTTDNTAARRENGSTFTKPDALKHLVIVVAAHELQAINEVYIDGVALGALDGNGYPTTGEWVVTGDDTRTVAFTTSVTLGETPLTVLQAYSGEFGGESSSLTPQTVTITGNTLNGPAGIAVQCDYTVARAPSAAGGKVRVAKHLGSDTQTTSSYLSSLNATRYTANHRLRGLAYVVVTLNLEESRFQGGPPNITFDVSGRKIFDPRTATTVWSDNPALCMRDFITAKWGLQVAAADVDDASVIAAANACDELITLSTGALNETNQHRYTCNGAFTTDSAAEATIESLAECMAGMVTYGAKWIVNAGVWTTPVLTLTDDDLHGQIEVAQSDTSMGDLFNGVRGQFMALGAQSPTDFNPYQNASYVTADGLELWVSMTMPYVNHLARARNLCRVYTERNRNGQVITYPATLKAWPVQVGDRVTVTSAEYGLTAKTYRVTDWQFGITSAVLLTLQEDDANAYSLADAAVADPAPNTDLPNPWAVAAITGLTASSGTTTLQKQGDGSVSARVLVSWNAVSDASVVSAGKIEVLWRVVGTDQWTKAEAAGSETKLYLSGVREGDPLVIEARARNALDAVSASAFIAHQVVGKSAPPANVAGFSYAIKPNQVVLNWTACADADYEATELRLGASWAAGAGAVLWVGAGTEFQMARPSNGTYTVWAAHKDTSANYSSAPVSVSVVVDNTIDPGVSLDKLIANSALIGPSSSYSFELATATTVNGQQAVTITSTNGTRWGAFYLAQGAASYGALVAAAANASTAAIFIGGATSNSVTDWRTQVTFGYSSTWALQAETNGTGTMTGGSARTAVVRLAEGAHAIAIDYGDIRYGGVNIAAPTGDVYQLLRGDGTWGAIGPITAAAAAVATFSGVKPGSVNNTNTWITVKDVAGDLYDVPAWKRT
jgi:hypothetical protein